MSARDEADAAFSRFVSQSRVTLTRAAWFLCGDTELAADLVQDVYVKTYVAWNRVRREEALTYARRVLVNTNIDRLRRHRAEVALADAHEPIDPYDAPGAVAERDQMARWLAVLPLKQRQVVVLRYVQDLSEQETAEVLGVSVGTVKSNASRALATLRSAIPNMQ